MEGVRITVVTPATLSWLKSDTIRPQDKADAAALRAIFDLEQEESP